MDQALHKLIESISIEINIILIETLFNEAEFFLDLFIFDLNSVHKLLNQIVSLEQLRFLHSEAIYQQLNILLSIYNHSELFFYFQNQID